MAAMLAKKLPEIAIDRVPARDVIDFFRDVTNANIFLNWRTLEVAGVTRQQPVTLRLREVSLRTVLWLLLDAAQAKPDTPLDFRVEKEVITISTAPDIALSENSAAGPATQKSPATAPRR